MPTFQTCAEWCWLVKKVQLFELNKTNMLSVEESGASLPGLSVSSWTAAAVWHKAHTSDALIKTS